MKQYWSFFKSGKFAFLALFFVSLTVISCDNDDDNNVSPDPPIEKGEIELAENAQALNYFDFINPNDVEILNADTTQIRVSQAYLDKIKTKVNKNDVLSIWRSIDTPPFIRKVSNVSANGKDAILTTTQGTLADLIEHGDFKLSTELYVNYGEKGLKNRYSKDGVYHPSVVIFSGTEDNGKKYATAEELLAQEATWHIFNKDGITNYSYEEKGLRIGLKDVQTHTALDLEIGINISWFKLRNFDCYFTGEYKLDGPLFVEWDVKDKSSGGEVPLVYYPPIVVVFPIAGPIHISVMVIFKTEVNIAYCGGPFVKVGPSVSTDLSASVVTGSDYQFKVNTSGKFKLAGKTGAELHIVGYSLGKWETEYVLAEKDAWNKEFIVDMWPK